MPALRKGPIRREAEQDLGEPDIIPVLNAPNPRIKVQIILPTGKRLNVQ